MAKVMRELTEESVAMEKEIAEAYSKKMNVKANSVTGKIVVNMAIAELHKKLTKNGK